MAGDRHEAGRRRLSTPCIGWRVKMVGSSSATWLVWIGSPGNVKGVRIPVRFRGRVYQCQLSMGDRVAVVVRGRSYGEGSRRAFLPEQVHKEELLPVPVHLDDKQCRGAALTARWRGERPAGQALVAVGVSGWLRPAVHRIPGRFVVHSRRWKAAVASKPRSDDLAAGRGDVFFDRAPQQRHRVSG